MFVRFLRTDPETDILGNVSDSFSFASFFPIARYCHSPLPFVLLTHHVSGAFVGGRSPFSVTSVSELEWWSVSSSRTRLRTDSSSVTPSPTSACHRPRPLSTPVRFHSMFLPAVSAAADVELHLHTADDSAAKRRRLLAIQAIDEQMAKKQQQKSSAAAAADSSADGT